ncbi:hypothetical protein K491DRAFT_698332 [Lophiostoma macrostomum CBS 122681]|uniref:Uncharacterized protein n=1 Tax=Lophiostoma macrostomum CBS 122681 TaxID=1314788 RepID=A0A6A6SRJ6_9PLEO|nr:hypothetical protein K491DRAFT_698332 [Lophiostoma macrostomum CBS 122681]
MALLGCAYFRKLVYRDHMGSRHSFLTSHRLRVSFTIHPPPRDPPTPPPSASNSIFSH